MTAMADENPLALLPELLLLTGAVAGLLVGLWTPQHKQGRVAVIAVVTCVASGAAAVPAVLAPAESVFEGTWAVDPLTGAVRIAVAVATVAAVLLTLPALSGHPRQTEAYVLMLLAAIGANALAASADLLMLAASYLLASVPLYALAGFAKDARGTEATMKYYLVGALSGVIMLVGVSVLVLAGGSTLYADLAAPLSQASTGLVGLGVLGLLAGVLFKAGAVPQHFWVPDVTAGTTPPMAAFITTVPKLGAVVAAFRLVSEPFAQVDLNVPLLVAVVATASMTLGNLAAFTQHDLLRLLAYSTISQVGYLFMVVAVAARSDLAVPALTVYVVGYAVTNVGAFAAVAALPGTRTIEDWSRASARHRWLLVSLVVCLLGLVGTPPTAVFVGKLAVFAAAGDGHMMWLVVVAAVNTVASLFYYLRWLAPAFRAGADAKPVPSTGGAVATVVTTSVAAVPAVTLHVAAVVSLGVGIGAGAWLTLMT